MKWKKLGRIFNPAEHTLANNCKLFAQSPQAVVFDDHVRIYFSTRERDEATGKFLSHISFADFSRDFSTIIRVADRQVIPLGELGCFDEHGIFPISPMRRGDEIWAYTCGWNRRVSVSVDTATGLAISKDNGLTFQKTGAGPVFGPSLHEPFLVGDSFVREFNGIFHMWYIYGLRWITNDVEEAARVYKIAHATSPDGINWERDGRLIIDDVLNEDECQALPTVIFHGGRYHMYFCFREAIGFRNTPGKGYRLGYAWSEDLETWTRDDNQAGIGLSPEGWDSEMMCYPHIFSIDDKPYLLYNGNAFGRDGFGIAVCED